jgi:hypothetical protein
MQLGAIDSAYADSRLFLQVDYGAKDAFKRGYEPQYPRDSDIDNWSYQFEPLCRTKKLYQVVQDIP